MQYPLDSNRNDCYCNHMNADDFSQRLRELREARGIGSRELSLVIERSPSFISLIESRQRYKHKLPPHEALTAIARAFGMTVDDLLGEDGQPREGEGSQLPTVVKRRLLSDRELFERFGIRPYDVPISVDGVYASAGLGARLPQDVDDSIPREFARSKYLREVDVRGDCMVPDLYPGEVVVYNVRLGAEIGKIMVAILDEEELLVKRLVLVGDDQFLHPNEGTNIRVDERIRFLGRAVAVTRRLL